MWQIPIQNLIREVRRKNKLPKFSQLIYQMAEVNELIAKVKDTEAEIEKNFASINQNPNDKIATLILGPTGSGKTTFYYAITGKPLSGMKIGRKRILEADVPNRKFEIGHDSTSKTDKPGIEYDQQMGIVFCDCPGLFDNRSEIQDITNSFSIFQVLNQAKNVKILLLISISDIQCSKGGPLSKSCAIVERLIQSRPALQQAIALIITKVPPSYCPTSSKEKLTLLDDVHSEGGWLLQYFKEKARTEDRNVFCFPSPDQTMIDNAYSGFHDRNLILKFIRNSPVPSITPVVSLSNQSKLMIIDIVGCFGSLADFLYQFVQQITIGYSESDDYLDLWKDRVDQLCSLRASSPKTFVNSAKRIISPSSERFDDLYAKFLKIDDWRSFLKRIALEEFGNENAADQCISQNSDLLSDVFLDVSKYLCEILTPTHSILLNKIEKRNIELKKQQTMEELRKLSALNEQILKEQQKQRELALKRKQELDLKYQERRKQIELVKIRNSGGGGGRGGGCLLI